LAEINHSSDQKHKERENDDDYDLFFQTSPSFRLKGYNISDGMVPRCVRERFAPPYQQTFEVIRLSG